MCGEVWDGDVFCCLPLGRPCVVACLLVCVLRLLREGGMVLLLLLLVGGESSSQDASLWC